MASDGVYIYGGALHEVLKVLLKDIVTGAVPSAAHVFKDSPVLNWKVASKPIPIDNKTVEVYSRATTQLLTCTVTSAPPIRISIQDIGSPRGSIGPQKFRNFHPLKTSVH